MFLLRQCFVLISLTLFQASSPASLPSSATDLLKFQDSLPLHSQKLLPWNQSSSSSSPCQWPGVSCYPNKSFQVKALNLSGYGLSGILNNSISYLCLHKHLNLLDLSGNHFTGAIPHLLGNCGQLNTILLNYNALEGSIPADVFKSKKLVQLDLGYNSLSGNIPPEGLLPDFLPSCAISDLWIHENAFSGSFPFTLSNCQNLTVFIASQNNFEGVIAPEIFKGLLQLEVLYLDGNKLEGEIPQTLWGLENLQELVLSGNKLNGTISERISQCPQLVTIALSGNNLVGHIPRLAGTLQYLTNLILFDNKLDGSLPSELGNCSSLVEIRLQNNLIGGNIPPEICNLENLEVLFLSNNFIEGRIPRQIGRLSNLKILALYSNNLSGIIPSEITNFTKLTYLSFAHNDLTGEVPFDLGKNSPDLDRLDLTSNHLHGPIPPNGTNSLALYLLSFGKLANLQSLRLSSNNLTGSIPSGLSHCRKLIKIDLSKNQFSGKIPSEITSLEKLESLLLQENKLSGAIPDSFSPFQGLFELQLSSNMLEGPIPCSLSKINHFSSVLNLSYNKLSGTIPGCLGNLDKLQILDLSSNSFFGEMPTELNNMISLYFVNISFNQLSGKLPTSWMRIVASYPGSFLGNPELCLLGNDARYCRNIREGHTRRLGRHVLAAVIICVVISMALLCSVVYIIAVRVLQHKYHRDQSLLRECQSHTEDLPEDLQFEDIMRATEGMSDEYVIGRGKHGTVYRTESANSRKNWAVKKVSLSGDNFSLEMRTLSVVRHRNIVRMGGYCIKDGYGFIVTEFMPGGTLFDVLHRHEPRMALDWETRYRIALGVAQALSYLHHDCVPQIIHRDVKSDNILMDSELEPKVGDFGMSKMLLDSDSSSTRSRIVGTLGYMAPENAYAIRLTEKVDVYSYGVILLEIVCRKFPVDPSFEEGLDIVSWTRKKLEENDECVCFLDREISFWNRDEQQKALKLLELALECTESVADKRPSMRDVVGSLIKLHERSVNDRDIRTKKSLE
ncbi:LEUCINE-RICH REPEAT RECEPTOR-LIKE PROTEIN KINASE PEPR1 [Salix koriyanagi]|uniref:non-specific serine/threonine protein kinase n=1 Tax=Salix koriyanagi TaxID=2511006 RepID=A0A9Q0WDF1_9ROSI|nr:LEUCINE-RICH REPEAT RECEPTOR-LIKE PROTEIN KINASE PEPR1 [Salix koriyanagi]